MLIFDPTTLRLITPHDVKEGAFGDYLKTGIVVDQTIPPAPGTLPPGNEKLTPDAIINLPPKSNK